MEIAAADAGGKAVSATLRSAVVKSIKTSIAHATSMSLRAASIGLPKEEYFAPVAKPAVPEKSEKPAGDTFTYLRPMRVRGAPPRQ